VLLSLLAIGYLVFSFLYMFAFVDIITVEDNPMLLGLYVSSTVLVMCLAPLVIFMYYRLENKKALIAVLKYAILISTIIFIIMLTGVFVAFYIMRPLHMDPGVGLLLMLGIMSLELVIGIFLIKRNMDSNPSFNALGKRPITKEIVAEEIEEFEKT
jgi:amino acid transporter